MALAFMLNPSRGRKARRKPNTKWARCMRSAGGDPRVASSLMKRAKGGCRVSAAARTALREGRLRRREAGARSGSMRRARKHAEMTALGASAFGNPRKKRRGSNGGRSMAKRKSRRRNATKRRSGRRRSSRRNPVARANPRRRRRRNVWRDDSAGHRKAARKGHRRRKTRRGRGGSMYRSKRRRRNPVARANPRRRRRRRNALLVRSMYSNPRKRRRGRRRRNPFGAGSLVSTLKSNLTNPARLMQFGAGAVGAVFSQIVGAKLAEKIRSLAPNTFAPGGTASWLLDTAAIIAVGALGTLVVPSKFRGAWMIGSGTAALTPLAVMAAQKTGLMGWISVDNMPTIGQLRGMGAWVTNDQMRRGFSGMRGLGDYSWNYGVPVSSMQDYSRQPAAMAAFAQ